MDDSENKDDDENENPEATEEWLRVRKTKKKKIIKLDKK